VPSRAYHSGFTLIELAVVVGVIIILLAVATPSLGGMLQERTVYNTAYQLLERIRTIQQLAVTHRVGYPTYQMSFDSLNGTYSTTIVGKTIIYRMPAGVSFSVSALTEPFSFDWSGSPRQGGTSTPPPTSPTVLSNPLVVTVSNSSGTKRVSVSVSLILGRVSIGWMSR